MFGQAGNSQLSFPPAFIWSREPGEYVLVTEHVVVNQENFTDYIW